jgi:hypothetical protein
MIWIWLGLVLSVASPDRGFSEGVSPIDIGAPFQSAQACQACHPAVTRDWAKSRHAAAHTNPLYRWGLVAEPAAFCLNCHSPQPEQVAEALTELPKRPGQAVLDLPTPLADEGVSCVACHMRKGRILAPWGSPGDHPQDSASDLRDPAFCAGCHEFRIPSFDHGELVLTDEPIQSTYSEWKDFRDAGGQGTCQSCHMPGGRHLFHGANEREALRASLRVDALRQSGQVVFAIRSVGVGHHMPSGDLFRHITLEVGGEGAWRTVARIGRDFQHTVDPETGVGHKTLSGDTALRPNEVRRVAVPSDTPLYWRAVYHYGSGFDERNSGLADAVLYETVASGQVR